MRKSPGYSGGTIPKTKKQRGIIFKEKTAGYTVTILLLILFYYDLSIL